MNDKRQDDNLDELLPWYVTGTLNEADTDAVEAALASRANAKALVNDETELSRRIARANVDLDDVLARQSDAFEQLRRRLTQQSDPDRGEPSQHTTRWRQVCAAALSMLLIVSVATSPWLTTTQPAGTFTTLSESTAGGTIQLVVAADVTPTEVRRLVAQIGGTVVTGPTPHNVYLIAPRIGSDLATEVAWLRGQPGVSFVGPVD